jgi:hypothetical protein
MHVFWIFRFCLLRCAAASVILLHNIPYSITFGVCLYPKCNCVHIGRANLHNEELKCISAALRLDLHLEETEADIRPNL